MVALLAALLARLVRPSVAAAARPLARLACRQHGGHGAAGAGTAVAACRARADDAESATAGPVAQSPDRGAEVRAPLCRPGAGATAGRWQHAGAGAGSARRRSDGAAVADGRGRPAACSSVAVDGKAGAALSRRGEQLLCGWIAACTGSVSVTAIGETDTASLRFTLRPQRVMFAGQGWSLDGIDDGRLLGDSVALHRTRAASDGSGAAA